MAANPYDLTTREVLSILFKERAKLLGVFFVLAALVVTYSLMMTRSYQASARLLVKSGREFQVRSDPNQPVAAVPSVTKQEVVNSEIQILTSRDLAEAVINKIGADRLYPPSMFSFSFFSGANKSASDATVRAFEADFRASPVELADVIEIGYRNPDPQLAVETLNTIIDLYQKKHAEMFADPRYKSLEQQTAQYEQQLDQATLKVTQIKNSQGVFDVDAQRSKLIDDRAATNTILQQLQATSVELHGRIEHLRQALKYTPQMVPGTSTQSEVLDQALALLLNTQMKALELQNRYNDPNIKPLQDAREAMGQLRNFIKTTAGARKSSSQRNPTYDDMSIALSRAEADAAPLDQQIAKRNEQAADIDARLRKLEEGGKALDDAQRERRTLEELVHTYRTQYEAARLAEEQNSANAVSVSLVQKPVASDQRFPSRVPYAVAGILIGIVGAGGMLIYLLVFRETLITVESVERIIGVPVLASVPNSRRPENDNRQVA